MATSMHEPDWDQMSELPDRRVGARSVRREVIHAEPRFDGILGHSAALTAVLTQLELVAPTDATVLLQGETGTGKALLARALHHRKPAASAPLGPGQRRRPPARPSRKPTLRPRKRRLHGRAHAASRAL